MDGFCAAILTTCYLCAKVQLLNSLNIKYITLKGVDRMHYDFTTLQSRTGTCSSKWDAMCKTCPTVPANIVPFSVADMEFRNPPEIADALSKYLHANILGYTNPSPDYFAAVQRWMQRRHNWSIQPEWIIDYPGVIPGIFQAVSCFTEPGDGILLLTPVYYPFYIVVQRSGRKLVESPLRPVGNHYEINFDDFASKAQDPSVKMCILCSPHNPVGRVWTKAELRRLSDICLANDVFMVCDEIHHDLVLPGQMHTVLASLDERTAHNCIICTAPTKTFNLAGMAVSNLIVPDPKRNQALRSYKNSQFMFECGICGYQACTTAYNQCEAWLDELLSVLQANKLCVQRFMAKHFPQIRIYDLEGTYLMWMDFSALDMSPEELSNFLQKEAYLFLDEGQIFGEQGAGFVRWNIACPTTVLQAGLERLYHAWQNHQT